VTGHPQMTLPPPCPRGVLVQVGLPDERGREQIFRVHTGGLARERALEQDVGFQQLAR
jgi:ATP-dependent 26S proteasome regulatory subunit